MITQGNRNKQPALLLSIERDIHAQKRKRKEAASFLIDFISLSEVIGRFCDERKQTLGDAKFFRSFITKQSVNI